MTRCVPSRALLPGWAVFQMTTCRGLVHLQVSGSRDSNRQHIEEATRAMTLCSIPRS